MTARACSVSSSPCRSGRTWSRFRYAPAGMIPISASSWPWKQRQRLRVQPERHAAARSHLQRVAQQSKAGDVCAGVRACIYNLFTSAVIERGHAGDQSGIVLLRHQPSLRSCGQNSSAQRLCQNQHVTGLCSYVFQNFVRMDEAGRPPGRTWARRPGLAVAAGDERPPPHTPCYSRLATAGAPPLSAWTPARP